MSLGDTEKHRKLWWSLWRDNWKFFNLDYLTIPIQVSYYQWTFPEKIAYHYLHVFGFRIARWRA